MIELTQTYRELDDEIANLNAQVKALEVAKAAIIDEIMEEMNTAGLASFNNVHGSFSLTKKVVASVQSWEEFYEYIRENNAFYLLERRASTKACAEELASTPSLPMGVDLIELPRLAVRKPK